MASTLRLATEALIAALRTNIDGGSGYVNNVTDAPTDRVQARVPDSLPLLPCVFLQDIQLQSTIEGVPLGKIRHDALFTVVGYTQGNGTTEDRALDAADLLSDIVMATMESRTLSGVVYDVHIDGSTAIDGLQVDESLPYGVCAAQIRAWWQTTAGA